MKGVNKLRALKQGTDSSIPLLLNPIHHRYSSASLLPPAPHLKPPRFSSRCLIAHPSRPSTIIRPNSLLKPPNYPLVRQIHSSPDPRVEKAEVLFAFSLLCFAIYLVFNFWKDVWSSYVEGEQFVIEQKRLDAVDKRLDESPDCMTEEEKEEHERDKQNLRIEYIGWVKRLVEGKWKEKGKGKGKGRRGEEGGRKEEADEHWGSRE